MTLGASCQKLRGMLVSGRRGTKFLRGVKYIFPNGLYWYCLIVVTCQIKRCFTNFEQELSNFFGCAFLELCSSWNLLFLDRVSSCPKKLSDLSKKWFCNWFSHDLAKSAKCILVRFTLWNWNWNFVNWLLSKMEDTKLESV